MSQRVTKIRGWLTGHSIKVTALAAVFFAAVCIVALLALAWHGEPLSTLDIAVVVGRLAYIVAVYVVMTVLMAGMGWKVLNHFRIGVNDRVRHFLFAVGVGMILTIVFFYAVSLLHLLSFAALAIYVILAFITAWKHLPRIASLLARACVEVPKPTFGGVAVCVTITTFFIVTLLSTASPFPVGGDELRTYYNMPRLFIDTGGIVDFPLFIFNNAPHIWTYLYIPFLFFGDFVLPYVSIYFFLLAILALVALIRRLDGVSAQRISSLLFLSMPWTFWFLASAKVEYLVVFFVLLAVHALYSADRAHTGWLALAGIFFGAAVGVKATAALFVPVLAALLLFWPGKQELGSRVKTVCIVFFFAWAILAPWGLRNALVFGNPLYPYVSARAAMSTAVDRVVDNRREQAMKNLHFVHATYIHGVNYVQSWMRNVWAMFTIRSHYPHNASGPLFMLLFPLILYGLIDRRLRPLIVLTLGALALWYWVSPSQLWYVMPTFALVSAVYAVALASMPRAIQRSVLTIIIVLYALSIDTARIEHVRFLLPRYSAETVVSAHQWRELSLFLNGQLATSRPEYVIYGLTRAGMRNGYVVDNHKHIFVQNEYLDDLDWYARSYEAHELLALFARAGVTHIYYNESSEQFWRTVYCPYDERGMCFIGHVQDNMERLAPYIGLIRATDDWKLYEIRTI